MTTVQTKPLAPTPSAPTNAPDVMNAYTTAPGASGRRAVGPTGNANPPKRHQRDSEKPLLNLFTSSLPYMAASDKKAEIERQQRKPQPLSSRVDVNSGRTLPPHEEAPLLLGQRHELKAPNASAACLPDADRGPSEMSRGPTKKELAAVAADARQQLGQPTYVALTARQVAAAQRWQQSHNYDHIVKGLHERLGVVKPTPQGTREEKNVLAKPLEVAADVTDKVMALRQAEMAEMVARLRRMVSEANITGVPIIPVASLGASGNPCPWCQYCIELTSEETIKEYLIAALQVLLSERVVAPMAGRCGPTSVRSSALSGNATTLDSFRAHPSRAHKRPAEAGAPSRYSVPQCFRIELVPFGLHKVSIHVSVHRNLVEHFFQAHARQQEHLRSPLIDPPFPREFAEWTDAHRQRLLHRVLGDLLHGGATPVVPADLKTIARFPAHDSATRDALWSSVWSARSLAGWLTISEDAVASYLGEEVMFFYAWMNHYARWLLGAGLLGVLVSMLSSLRLVPDTAAAAVLVPAASSSITLRRTVQHCLDVALLPLFSTTMIIGSVLCIKMWERRCSALCMRYHLFQQEGKDVLRHDFRGTPGTDPVTGEPQLCYPACYRLTAAQSLTWGIVALFMGGTLGLMVCSLNLDGMVTDPASRLAIPFLRRLAVDGGLLDKTAHPIAGMLPPLAYSVCIGALSFIFTDLAKYLTRMENNRYRGEYMRSLTLKRAAFEFVNSYGKLLFIAFGRCRVAELSAHLRSMFYVAVLSRMMSHTVIPFVVTHRRRVVRRLFRASGGDTSSTPSEGSPSTPASLRRSAHGGSSDSPLEEVDEMLDLYDICMDFIEILIQFGYILLFAAAYPLASFVALLSNIIEVRSHLFKMCYVMRRPVPRLGVQQNATWCGIMRGCVIAAVITNTFLLALTSHQTVRWFPEYFTATGTLAVAGLEMVPSKGHFVVFYCMVMEYVMCLIAVFLLWCIPSTPREVRYYKTRKLYERVSLQ
ncbi:Calcium-activated chloride channel family protein [Leishmania donovani]|uniref:Calcium-activated chloride channel family protein n=1 Tax=Leishmania donovani TaxID=5661 RepID=A0A504XG97_LEIDO|nr:Calcium-activated chloride channel family protein [Leishmania donovani]